MKLRKAKTQDSIVTCKTEKKAKTWPTNLNRQLLPNNVRNNREGERHGGEVSVMP